MVGVRNVAGEVRDLRASGAAQILRQGLGARSPQVIGYRRLTKAVRA